MTKMRAGRMRMRRTSRVTRKAKDDDDGPDSTLGTGSSEEANSSPSAHVESCQRKINKSKLRMSKT